MLQSDHVETAGKSVEEVKAQLQLILLDFGLAEELTPKVTDHLKCDGFVWRGSVAASRVQLMSCAGLRLC